MISSTPCRKIRCPTCPARGTYEDRSAPIPACRIVPPRGGVGGRVPLACGSFPPPENWGKYPHFSTYMRGGVAIVSEHFFSQRWHPQIPAMAAGLTDQVWTLREVLMFRVPP